MWPYRNKEMKIHAVRLAVEGVFDYDPPLTIPKNDWMCISDADGAIEGFTHAEFIKIWVPLDDQARQAMA